jgi:hypothetical protein
MSLTHWFGLQVCETVGELPTQTGARVGLLPVSVQEAVGHQREVNT